MTNRYHGKYIVVDTTDTQIGGPNTGGGVNSSLAIKAIQWVGTQASTKDIAQNDDLTIRMKDANGDIVIAARAQEAVPYQIGYSIDFGSNPWIVPGLYIDDLDGGELIIFLE